MEFDLHGLTLVEAIRAYPEQAAVIMQKQAMELAQQSTNKARQVPDAYTQICRFGYGVNVCQSKCSINDVGNLNFCPSCGGKLLPC